TRRLQTVRGPWSCFFPFGFFPWITSTGRLLFLAATAGTRGGDIDELDPLSARRCAVKPCFGNASSMHLRGREIAALRAFRSGQCDDGRYRCKKIFPEPAVTDSKSGAHAHNRFKS